MIDSKRLRETVLMFNCWYDFATPLSRICRWSGRVEHYSVLSHSLLVGSLVRDVNPRWEIYGLLHDAHESIVGDVSQIVKPPEMMEVENLLMYVIRQRFGVPHPASADVAIAVDEADLQAACAEYRVLKPSQVPKWDTPWPVGLADELIDSFRPKQPYYLARLKALFCDRCASALVHAIMENDPR